MTVKVYRSTDTSAPTLNGQVGSLISVLDAVLVNGYGAKSSLGWTKPFTGTNLGSYRNGTGGNQLYLDVNDANAGSSGDYFASVRGYEVMTAVGTGTAPFPTVAQAANLYWVKSQETANTTATQWIIVGTQKMFFMWVKVTAADIIAPQGDNGYIVGFFGDINSFRSGDTYNTIVYGQTTRTPIGSNNFGPDGATGMNSSVTGHYMARSFTQSGTSIQVGKSTDCSKMNGQASPGVQGMVYPNPADGGLYLAPYWIHEPGTLSLRGVLPGIWAPLHPKPLVTYDTFSGTGNLTGKSFLGLQTRGAAQGEIFLEISDTW
jgi:hypothetical protein